MANASSIYTIHESYLNDPAERPVKVVGIGCGMAGILLAYKLQKHCENVQLQMFERHADIGGTWYTNRYPGAGCDIPIHAYSFPFALNPDWPQYCAFREDIWEYLSRVCDVFGLRQYMEFGSAVQKCVWHADLGQWQVQVEQLGLDGKTPQLKEEWCDILCYASGIFSTPELPKVKGLEKFKGQIFHSSQWPQDWKEKDWAEERIAVLGSGASSIQIVPQLQPHAKHLELFIRQGIWFGAILDNFGWFTQTYDDKEREAFRKNPQQLVDHVKGLERKMNWAVGLMTSNSDSQLEAQDLVRVRMRDMIKDDAIFKGLLPNHAIGCRRMTPGDPYIKAIQNSNVTVNFTGAHEFTETGIIGDDGITREVDTIICATGFDTSFCPRFPIIGKDGVSLSELWREEPTAYFALMSPDMPNWFTFESPGGTNHNGSVMGPLAAKGDFVVQCIQKMQRDHIKAFRPTHRATDQLNEHQREWMKRMVWNDECRSWFKSARTGEVSALWCGTGIHYTDAIRSPRWEDFDIQYRRDNPFSYLGKGYTLVESRENADWTPFLSVDGLDPRWVDAMSMNRTSAA